MTFISMAKFTCKYLSRVLDHQNVGLHTCILGRFRTCAKTITIMNTSSLCTCVQIMTSSSKWTWFCWFASICGHFLIANAMPFDYLKNGVFVIVFVLVWNPPIQTAAAFQTCNNMHSWTHVTGHHHECSLNISKTEWEAWVDASKFPITFSPTLKTEI
jgi:hypothetical protein